MSKQRALISCIHLQRCFEEFRSEFEDRGIEVELPAVDQQLPERWLLRHAPTFDGVIAGDDPFPRSVLAAGREGKLKALVKWGIGTDAIDLGAAMELGISVRNTPGMFGDEVADVALGYVILLARQLHRIDRAVRDGVWLKPVGMSLRGKTLGVVGLGSIGRSIARRAEAFGMRVVGHDPVAPADSDGTSVVRMALTEVLAASDFIVLACNLTDENHHLIDRAALASAKPGARLVNVARGPLVEEEALCEALDSGRLAAAALDVFEQEPLEADSPLRAFDQCIFGSHNASNTEEAVQRVNRLAVNLLFELLAA